MYAETQQHKPRKLEPSVSGLLLGLTFLDHNEIEPQEASHCEKHESSNVQEHAKASNHSTVPWLKKANAIVTFRRFCTIHSCLSRVEENGDRLFSDEIWDNH